MTEKTRVVHVKDNIPGAIYVGRAMPRQGLKASKWANPHKIGPGTSRADAIILYEQHLTTHPELWALMPDLRDKPLACWCRHDHELRTPENWCHGDVLVNLLRFFTDDELRAMGGQP